jgi:hypothetical protein
LIGGKHFPSPPNLPKALVSVETVIYYQIESEDSDFDSCTMAAASATSCATPFVKVFNIFSDAAETAAALASADSVPPKTYHSLIAYRRRKPEVFFGLVLPTRSQYAMHSRLPVYPWL